MEWDVQGESGSMDICAHFNELELKNCYFQLIICHFFQGWLPSNVVSVEVDPPDHAA